MKYRYQLILLGSIEDSIVEEIKTQIILEITNLKLPEGILNIIDRSNWEEDYVGNQPTFSIYFGDKNGNFKDLPIVDKLIKDGTMILPVYYNNFSDEIPKELENQNGILYNDTLVSR